jgi:hypothetical protein
MIGLFFSPKLSHTAVYNVKYLVSSSNQICHSKLYRISNVWSLPVTKTVTQCCRVYHMFARFKSPNLSHKPVQNIKFLVSSSHQNVTQGCTKYQKLVSSSHQKCHIKMFRISNIWTLLFTKTVTQS